MCHPNPVVAPMSVPDPTISHNLPTNPHTSFQCSAVQDYEWIPHAAILVFKLRYELAWKLDAARLMSLIRIRRLPSKFNDIDFVQ